MSDEIAVIAGMSAAVVLGVATVAEQNATKRVAQRRALSPRILLDLARQPLWVASIGGTVSGFVLQVIALRYGALALVQPILVCDLIFAVLIRAAMRRYWDPVLIAGVLATALGVGGFLAVAQPSGGRSSVSFFVVLPLAAGLAAVLAVCLVFGSRSEDLRPLALALACGICYGTSAFLVKLLTAGSLAQLFTTWPLYALAVIAPVGFVLNQNAFQQGSLLAPVLSIITVCDPIVSITLGALWLGETLQSTPAAITGQVAFLLLMVGGIILLAQHSPHALKHHPS